MASGTFRIKTRKELREVEVEEREVHLTLSEKEAQALFGIVGRTNSSLMLGVFRALRTATGLRFTEDSVVSNTFYEHLPILNDKAAEAALEQS